MFKNISAPFTDEQQDAVFNAIRQHLVPKNKAISQFVDLVLAPEVFVKIYALFFGVSKAQAEKNLMQQGVYCRSSSESSNEPF